VPNTTAMVRAAILIIFVLNIPLSFLCDITLDQAADSSFNDGCGDFYLPMMPPPCPRIALHG
jgi:hypothetical protein